MPGNSNPLNFHPEPCHLLLKAGGFNDIERNIPNLFRQDKQWLFNIGKLNLLLILRHLDLHRELIISGKAIPISPK